MLPFFVRYHIGMKKLLHFSANATGRDFVVGDIHGCYDLLMKALDALSFDPTRDRLFSCGDLIDRGPDNVKCLNLLFEPWFASVKGNHEDMMFDSLINNNRNHEEVWMYNGGSWMCSEDRGEMIALAKAAYDKMPLVITVGEGPSRFNVIHAEITHHDGDIVTDSMIDKELTRQWPFDENDEYNMLWGRYVVRSKNEGSLNVNEVIQSPTEMSLTFCGHTPVRKPCRVHQQVFIDTGAVFGMRRASEQYSLSIAEPNAGNVHTYSVLYQSMMTRTIESLTIPTE